jgi:Zn finger protein HypA/HybF involved in hydrogenase expression
MRAKLLAVIFITSALLAEVAFAGQSGEFYCASCGYKTYLVTGGTKRSAAVTIYCPRCKSFSRKAFASWEEANRIREFTCSQCSAPASVYWGRSGFPCPKCGSVKTKFEVREYFD